MAVRARDRLRLMRRTVVLAVLSVVVLACGKRGDPKPPVPVIPQATSDLAVTQRANRVILSWSYPALTTAGKSLPSFRRVTVFRYSEDLPVVPGGRDPKALLPGDVDPAVPQPIALFSKIPAIPKSQFVRLATRVESIEHADLGSATAGAKLIFSDAPPFVTTDGRPVRLTYAVVTEGESSRGDYSNLATVVPLPVAVPPGGLAAEARPEGVRLTWNRPEQAAGGAEAPVVSGYHVFRLAPGEELSELAAPITTAPVSDTTFTDTPPYGDHVYRVSAVASTGPPLLQSEPSAPATVTFRDLVPPPQPANFTPLVETASVRLVWDAVEAPDLAGYKVYRHEGVGHEEGQIRDAGGFHLTYLPIKETTWVDTTVRLGIAFRYQVTSVDKSGNESKPVETGWVVVPKTP